MPESSTYWSWMFNGIGRRRKRWWQTYTQNTYMWERVKGLGKNGSGMTGEMVMVNDRRLDLGTHCLGKSIKYVQSICQTSQVVSFPTEICSSLFKICISTWGYYINVSILQKHNLHSCCLLQEFTSINLWGISVATSLNRKWSFLRGKGNNFHYVTTHAHYMTGIVRLVVS